MRQTGGDTTAVHLPFAGIILFRFYGYILSLHLRKHPGMSPGITPATGAKLKGNFTLNCNFLFGGTFEPKKTAMNKILVLVALLGLSIGAPAQDIIFDENVEVRQVGNFTGIDVSGTISLYLNQGTENALAISAGDPKYNSKIHTDVKDGVLKIWVDGGFWNGMGWANRKLKAYVSVVSPNSITVSGASLVSVSGALQADALKIGVSGASEIKGNFAVQQLNVEVSGASVARLSGSATNALLDASGACKINAYELVAQQCKANASGASNVRISVKEQFNAASSGGANIYYRGNPSVINVNSGAGASIKQRSITED